MKNVKNNRIKYEILILKIYAIELEEIKESDSETIMEI
jgi:hypothetical protein